MLVPAYRIHFIDQGHTKRPEQIIECADEFEAIKQAQQAVDGHDVELWDGSRLVVRLRLDRSK